MTLILKPRGRGNWAVVTMTLDAPADLFPALRDRALFVGQEIVVAGLVLRVCEVRP